jgi:alcohol dehydrogenase (NADP+)
MFDIILDTVAASHDLDAYLTSQARWHAGAGRCARTRASIAQRGHLIFKRAAIAGSMVGGLSETQEMLDFCAEKNIVADIEMISVQDVDKAYERMLKSDVKYRFVIDNASLAG